MLLRKSIPIMIHINSIPPFTPTYCHMLRTYNKYQSLHMTKQTIPLILYSIFATQTLSIHINFEMYPYLSILTYTSHLLPNI